MIERLAPPEAFTLGGGFWQEACMLLCVLTQTVVHLEQNQCLFCVGGGNVVFDWCLDLHTCLNCGARQSHKGWVYGIASS